MESPGKATLPTQHVPTLVTCAVTLLIPVLVAVVNHIMVLSDVQLLKLKFSTVEDVMVSAGVVPGTAVLVGMACACAAMAASLVTLGAPMCAGSGIPEVLGFLNGNTLPGLFTPRSFVIRVVAIVLVQVAGFPVGREGPMVAIGGGVGFGVAWLLLRPQEKRWEEVVASTDSGTGSLSLASTGLVVNEERFAYIRRVGCALGGAAGIATAFNAPIGGILYMFEELAVSSLPPELARFMCTVFGTLAARALLKLTQMDVHHLVIYEDAQMLASGAWEWADVPLIILLSAVLGCGGALFSKALLTCWSFRKTMAGKLQRYQPWAKIAECVAYCALCSVAWGLAPSFFACQDAGDSQGEGHRRLGSDKRPGYVRHSCPEGHYNEVACYLLSGAEGAVKHLFNRSSEVQRSGPMLVAVVFYFGLACGMPGLAVPMGTFVPSMLAGGLVGRIFGENMILLAAHIGGPTLAPAGVYAVVGSAATLSGLTHMTVGIVALLAEASSDFSLIAPLMLAVLVAQAVSKLFSNFGYDEHLIIMKGIPFLDPEMPREMEAEGLTAADICAALPDEAMLPPQATLKAIKRALRQKQVKYFPIIVEGSICVGLTTRGRLRAVLEAISESTPRAGPTHPPDGERQRRPSVDSNSSAFSDGSISNASTTSSASSSTGFRRMSTQGHLVDVQAEAKLRSLIKVMFAERGANLEDGDCAKDAQEHVPLDRIMDPAPHVLSEDMPVSRFYNLFNKTGANVAVVNSKRGRFRSVITRADLIDAQARLHTAGHKARASSSPSSPASASSPPKSSAPREEEESPSVGDREFEAPPETSGGQDLQGEAVRTPRDDVASAVAANMSQEELQAELRTAWRRAAKGEEMRDRLENKLKASEQRIRDLELQLFGIQAPRTGSKARSSSKSSEGAAVNALV